MEAHGRLVDFENCYCLYKLITSLWNSCVRRKDSTFCFMGGNVKEKTQKKVDMLRSLGTKTACFSWILNIYIMLGDLKILAQKKYNLSK